MSNNLAAFFATQKIPTNQPSNSNNGQINPNADDDEDMGPSISMAIEAENDEDFHNSTFKLKRTRSMGLLDPSNNIQQPTPTQQQLPTPNVMDEYDYVDDDDTASSSTSSDDENNNNNMYLNDIDMKNNTLSPSVSPPPPDNDKLLPQDDNDVVREPQRHVDYLSHHWKESEISNSWKYIIAKKKKTDIDDVNTARLENASWRTWAKARNNLKTVSPEILNWSKDSDVTWLYGPIVRGGNKKKKPNQKDDYIYDNHDDDDEDEEEDDDNSNSNSNSKDKNADKDATQHSDNYERGYGSDGDETTIRLPSTSPSTASHSESITKYHNPSKRIITPKPILKRRTMTEIIEENAQWKLNQARKHYNEVRNAQSVMDPNHTSVHDDYDLLAAKVNAQYFNYPPTYNSSYSSNQQNQQSYSTIENNNNYNEQSNINNEQNLNNSNSNNDPNNNINNIKSNDNNNITLYHELEDPNSRYNESNINKSDTNGITSDITDDLNGGLSTSKSVPVLNSNHRNIYTISSTHDGGDMKNGTLSSILATPSHVRLKNNQNNIDDGADTKKPKKFRHIHFNDRVEQCMALKYANGTPTTTTDIDMDGDFYSSEDEDEYHEAFSDYTDSESDSNSNEGENDDEHGLFINARFSRRSDSIIHSPITDNSSIGSTSVNGRQHPHIRPIIKMLPATTLNYGSDEESDSGDYNAGYGNAVSHNVNTQRGYDYIYDYNSVYTGDTSSFLPVDSCDIIDVPEGMDFQTAIADDKQKDYDMLSPQNSLPNQPPQIPISPGDVEDHIYSSDDDQYSMSSNTDDDQFIEDSHRQDLYDESDSDFGNNEDNLLINSKSGDDNLELKRTMSIGRSSNSLVQLSHQGSSSTSLKDDLSYSFIKGQPLNNTSLGGNTTQNRSSAPLKRNTSKSFVFGSESESDSDNESVIIGKENITKKLQGGDLNLDTLQTKASPRRKLGPPQRSSSSLLLDSVGRSSSSDLSKSINISTNTSTAADVVPSDIAIEGSFSPRNDSLKSVLSKEKIMNDHAQYNARSS